MNITRLCISGLLICALTACTQPAEVRSPAGTSIVSRPTPTSQPVTLESTASPVPTLSPAATPSAPAPCQRPPDDYTRIAIDAHTLNARTLWMLNLADQLYAGRGDPLAITQGSYVDDEPASFGTHAGGGAVDISVRVKDAPNVILRYSEMVELVRVLRQAGFAAWLRLPEDLNPPTAEHIHAIAVGDAELSDAARRQLDGPEGYFRGFDGVPPEQGGTKADRYGDPVVCDWMVELGFSDLR